MCDDGGRGEFSDCALGSDCFDCGERLAPSPPPLLPPAPPDGGYAELRFSIDELEFAESRRVLSQLGALANPTQASSILQIDVRDARVDTSHSPDCAAHVVAVNVSATPADLERAATALAPLLEHEHGVAGARARNAQFGCVEPTPVVALQCQSAAVRTRIGPLNATEAKRVRLALDLVHDLAAASSVLNARVTRGRPRLSTRPPTSTIFPVR